MNSINDIINLIATRGAATYGGEAITQQEHAMQCAMQAEEAGAAPELISAALLHDFGHLIQAEAGQAGISGSDDLHQYMAIPFLRPLFGSALLDPIRLHVDAKRYLCFADPDYWASLSPASKHSLQLQGGLYSAVEARVFMQQPHAADAIKLRIWDDRAKVPNRATPDIQHYFGILRQCLTDPRHTGHHGKIAGLHAA